MSVLPDSLPDSAGLVAHLCREKSLCNNLNGGIVCYALGFSKNSNCYLNKNEKQGLLGVGNMKSYKNLDEIRPYFDGMPHIFVDTKEISK